VDERLNPIAMCASCGAEIRWTRTRAGKKMPVDAVTIGAGEFEYDPTKHTSHFATCPHASDWRKKKATAAGDKATLPG
jgi:hypothetical protein